jgi:hypothetical protein
MEFNIIKLKVKYFSILMRINYLNKIVKKIKWVLLISFLDEIWKIYIVKR